MDWRDEGVLLSVRRHGESAAIIECFTREHGRHAGVVRGGASRRMAPLLQPGAQLTLEWRARLAEHIGSYRVELERSRAGALLNDGDALAALGRTLGVFSYERTLERGFAVVRDCEGSVVASAGALPDDGRLEIQFQGDVRVTATTGEAPPPPAPPTRTKPRKSPGPDEDQGSLF